MSKKGWALLTVTFTLTLSLIFYFGCKATELSIEEGKVNDDFDWIITLSLEADYIEKLDDGCFEVTWKDGKKIYLDETGKEISYEDKTIRAVYENELYGFKLGDKWIIEPMYDEAEDFYGDYAAVGKSVKISSGDEEITYKPAEYIINKENEICYPKNGKGSEYLSHIQGNYYLESISTEGSNETVNYIVDATKAQRIKELKSYTCYMSDGRGGYLGEDTKGEDDGKTRYIYFNKDFSVDFEGKIFKEANKFSEGYSFVKLITNGDVNNVPEGEEIKCGYINEKGEMVIELENPIDAGMFSEGKAIVYYKDRVEAINTKGEVIYSIPLEEKIEDEYSISTGEYCDGFVPISNGKKVGIVDEEGNWVVGPLYYQIKTYKETLSIVTDKNYKMGLLKLEKGGKQ